VTRTRIGVDKALGRADLLLLMIVAIVNINIVPPVAIYGKASVLLWGLAFAGFLIPETVAVLAMATRHPGEGGIYLWARKEFGEAHGFLAGWCYWTNNLFYIPMVLVYMAGIFAFGGGAASAHLVDQKVFVAGVAFGWLALITALNVRGLGVGKWIQNIGAIGVVLSTALVLLAALMAWRAGVAETPPLVAGAGWGMGASFSVMCFAFVGIELASTMGDEIRDPERNLRPAILAAGVIALLAYALSTAAVLALVPIEELGAIQGVMQAVTVGANNAGASWIVGPMAIVLGIAIGGSASAWFAGSSRVPFVASLDSALPAALGKVHPRWHSPYVALITCAVVSAVLMAVSLVGSTVGEAYEFLLKAGVVIQLIPFVYLFLGLARLSDVSAGARAAGVVGLATTLVGIGLAFLPGAEVEHLLVFEIKLVVGVVGPTAIGWWLFQRSVRNA